MSGAVIEDINDVTEELRPISRDLISQFDIYFEGVNLECVKFLEVTYNKDTKYFARCHPVNEIYYYFTNCFYIIEIALPICNNLTEDQKRLVLLHELFHIPPFGTDPDDKAFCKVRPHNVQDFRVIVEQHGTLWCYDNDLNFFGE